MGGANSYLILSKATIIVFIIFQILNYYLILSEATMPSPLYISPTLCQAVSTTPVIRSFDFLKKSHLIYNRSHLLTKVSEQLITVKISNVRS